ncbi:TraB/GumN family protein [Leisingera methylohalidivorans]|uniref:Conjugative transfer protein GumN n=1 Tax=Leisingera methylohalidivorans DSM 14336 TaxID=999552 RepID=V9VR02_9RHOB|nr:TraB/GumN family protein [Leisingera methylohalidivorans]AHD00139.1 conjugative transfer protein GumN [Leisingera methylohalidivorans DSM 14336]
MRLFLTLIFLLLPASLWAACTGTDLRTTLAAQERAHIEARIQATPFAKGNHWIARRGSRTVHVIGTLHINDPRMEEITAGLAPLVRQADLLLMEASPADKAALESKLGRDPSLMLITEGPSLIDRLPAAEWEALAAKVRSHGMAPWMAARMRPWFLAMSMSFPPCLRQAKDIKRGLDARLGELALAADVPVQSLEDPMSVIRMMDADPLEEQVRQLRAFTAMMGGGTDGFITTVEAYFSQDALYSLFLSERDFLHSDGLTRAERETLWAGMMQELIDRRNRNWIPVIEAAKGDRIAVAAGALHLPGETGVLNLLQQEGYSLERAPF